MSLLVLIIGLTFFVLMMLAISIVRINTYRCNIKESINLLSLPIVQFKIGGKDYNFLVDSGATDNHINGNLVETLDPNSCIPTNKITSVRGVEGNAVDYRIYVLQLFDGKHYYKDFFTATNLSASFDIIKEETGVEVHGILGTAFLNKYHCKLNYNSKTFTI